MARQALAVQTIVEGGLNMAMTAAHADGHKFPNKGKEKIRVLNGSGGSINVTIATGKTVQGLAVADKVVAVPAGETRFIGPFNSDLYNQPSGADAGQVFVDFSAQASVTLAAFR